MIRDFHSALARRKAKKAKRKAKAKIIYAGKPTKVGRKIIVAKLDAIFSLFIRARGKSRTGGKCEICQNRPIQACFHWVSRAAFATRWDPENAVASCHGCNFEETFRKQKYRDLHINRVGIESRESLEAKAREATHIPTVTLESMVEQFKRMIEARVW